MPPQNITLDNILVRGNLEAQFRTTPDITKQHLIDFYQSMALLLQRLDPEINDLGQILFYRSRNLLDGVVGRFLPDKYNKSYYSAHLSMAVQGRSMTLRTHTLTYTRDPVVVRQPLPPASPEAEACIYIETTPNIRLTSTLAKYSPEDLVKKLTETGLVDVSHYVLISTVDSPKVASPGQSSYHTSTGVPLRVVR